MGDLIIKKKLPERGGCCVDVTPQSAGWGYVSFSLHRLESGKSLVCDDAQQERFAVILSGAARFFVDGQNFGGKAGRDTPFDPHPWAVYAPAGARLEVVALSGLEVALCRAPAPGKRCPPRLVGPDLVMHESRGKGPNTRHVCNLLGEYDEYAESLLVVEVITPAGNWSSYPPYKHDSDNFPHETALEAVYHHRFNPPCGFGFQRIYTDSRDLDVTFCIEDGDTVLVPGGYHPCAAAHGYDLYYLNVMAGPRRAWRFHEDPAHQWLSAGGRAGPR